MNQNLVIPKNVIDYGGGVVGMSWRNGKKVLVLGLGCEGTVIAKCTVACPVNNTVKLIVCDFESAWNWFTSTQLDLPEGKVQTTPLTKG